MKYRFLILVTLVLMATIINAQNQKKALKFLEKFDNPEQIQNIKKLHPEWDIQISTTLGIDSLKYPKAVKANIGEIYENQYDSGKVRVLFRVLRRWNGDICKLKYIYFDGSKMNMKEIDSLRAVVMLKYRSGQDFTDLVHAYTMDSNPTGDLGWFYKGQMVPEFEQAVFPQPKDALFTVDVPSRKWYYVVLKTHANIFTSLTETVGIQFH